MNERLQLRLEALGVDLRHLPDIDACTHCHGADGPTEMSCDLIAGTWTVWCGCGHMSDPSPDLAFAIREFNARNNREQSTGTH